mmetsp:Transcript_24413/g.96872  ORF Transcript_24413/g.96872 Transcript_24413/m.96872 type:complete len:88 (+) Transcript_24413:85-348(+)
MGNAFGGISKEEKEKRAAELRKNVTMTEHQEELETLLEKLETDGTQGLRSAKASAHFVKFGRNELTPPPQTPWYIKFINEMTGCAVC